MGDGFSSTAEEWTLVTVTYGGEVHSSRHASRYDAEQAKCMALHGRTLEDQAEVERKERERFERNAAKWRAEHPDDSRIYCEASAGFSPENRDIKWAECFPSRPAPSGEREE